MSASPGSDWTNSRLVEECLRGNEQAWHVLIDRYKNLIYSIPLRYGAPHQDAADIFQRVCLDLFNELPRLRDAEAERGAQARHPPDVELEAAVRLAAARRRPSVRRPVNEDLQG